MKALRGRRRVTVVLAVAVLPALMAGAAVADEALRVERRGIEGDPVSVSASEAFAADELHLRSDRRLSAYGTLRGDFSGALAGDDGRYRSGSVRRASLTWENDQAPVPFRVKAGDLSVDTSARTFNRSIDGASVLFRPRTTGPSQSMRLFSGSGEGGGSRYSGGRWRIEDTIVGAVSLSAIRYDGPAAEVPALEGINQDVGSLSWQRDLTVAGQRLSMEMEYGRFSGDYDAAGGHGHADTARFLALSGEGGMLPYDWRLSYERYGEDYRPAGADIPADQRITALQGGWRLAGGLAARARVRYVREALESDNPVDVRLTGLSLTGSMGPGDFSTDAFVSHREDELGEIERVTRALSANYVWQLIRHATLRAGLAGGMTRNRIEHSVTRHRRASIALDWRLWGGAWRASLSSVFAVRYEDGVIDYRGVRPTLGLSYVPGP
ncbi:hypothetical protein KBTX_04037 [wastewater metagenome]|uniref:LPS-assembly protein LptD n=3 Tax=root TaxID=1 RepID=A0A5B8RGH0_9ZZZZ|nr:hypothetical protein KBTEX_04037 [uncultured organism]